MSKNLDETARLQSEKGQEWIRKIRGERLQGIAEGASSAPRLASSSAASFPGRNECPGTETRGVSPDKINLADTWLHGLPFLVCCEREWPKQPFLSEFDDSNDPELKKVKVSSNTLLRSASDSVHHLLRHYSDIKRLRRSVVWLTGFMLYLK